MSFPETLNVEGFHPISRDIFHVAQIRPTGNGRGSPREQIALTGKAGNLAASQVIITIWVSEICKEK